MGSAQRHRPAECAAGGDIQVIQHRSAGRYSLVIIRGRDGKRRAYIWVGVGDAIGRAECNDVARLSGRMAVEVAGGIVVSVTVDGRAAILDDRSPEIQIPGHIVARPRHAIRTAAAVIGGAEFSAQALAPDHISSRILILHVCRAEVTEIGLAGRIDAVVGGRIVKLDGDREIEGVHQADIVVVAAGGGTGQGELSQRGCPRAAVGTLQLAAISCGARSLAGAVEGAIPASPEPACDPGHRNGGGDTRARGHFQSPGRAVEYRSRCARPRQPDSLGTAVLDGKLAGLGRSRKRQQQQTERYPYIYICAAGDVPRYFHAFSPPDYYR